MIANGCFGSLAALQDDTSLKAGFGRKADIPTFGLLRD